MPLPPLPGWLIDYATAREVFVAHPRATRQKVVNLCAGHLLKFCACEEPSFKSVPDVRKHFIDDQNCRCNLNADIASIASALPDVVGGKKLHPKDHSVRMITACAIYHNYGIVTQKSGLYVTSLELGLHQGLTCLPLDQFVASI